MVALKPEEGSSFRRSSRTKQERRGGIETVFVSESEKILLPRSRNAVVALKQDERALLQIARFTKQERRGGIETIVLPPEEADEGLRSRNAVVALKRGCLAQLRRIRPDEAGTPWWY